MTDPFEELNPPARLLMGPGPINADPRVLRAMSMPLVGQFDPAFTRVMDQTMVLLRRLFQTENRWAILVDGTARAGIEALLVSAIVPGDRVVVPIFGRFGHLLAEIAQRCGAEVHTLETEWGTVFPAERIEDAVRRHRPKLLALVHGDTSTTMAQPLDEIGAICRRHGALLYVDATATLGGMDLAVDRLGIDAVSAGLQKCLSGPPGIAPVTFNERYVESVIRRKHVERGVAPAGFVPGDGPAIRSNYFDIPMLMDYWGPQRLNHHTEAASMVYAAREAARIVLQEGLAATATRHRRAGAAMAAGLAAMGLALFGDQAHRMPNVTGALIPAGLDGEAVRRALLADFAIEIGTSFGPLHGRIWRIGTMGYNARRDAVLTTLAALEATLRRFGARPPPNAAIDAALGTFDAATESPVR
jgi:(S)-ureidoglycine-glyoxylate aminotransferase